MKSAKRSTLQLLTLFKERAATEEEYAKRLSKLSKGFEVDAGTGTMTDAISVVRDELESSSRSHMSTAVEIRNLLETACSEFLVTQTGFQGILDRQLKLKHASLTAATKAQERYVAKCNEVNQLMHQKPGLPPKEMEKVKLKLAKSQHQSKQNDLTYLVLVSQHNTIQQQYQQDFSIACRECEKLWRDTFEFQQSKLWTYANLLSGVCVSDDEGYERIRVSLESCSPETDLSLLLTLHTTGTDIPPPLAYINYYTGTSSRPLDAFPAPPNILTGGRKNSATNVHSIREYRRAAGVVNPEVSVAESTIQEASHENTSGVTKWAVDTIAGLFGVSNSVPAIVVHRENSMMDSGSEAQSAGAREFQPNPTSRSVSESASVQEYDPYDVPENVHVLCEVTVAHAYTAQSFEELSLREGQILPVIAVFDDGWAEAVVVDDSNGCYKKGLFPMNFTKEISN
ncbi:hypothetical protein HDU98_002195 [Podochytrium sp. JEL0797]|nr:hypothetical protein HDU98_002195 [Podochytrium sp. JEL0797]